MKESLIELCNRVINNYKKSKEDFRYDGEYINHFASLIYGNRNKEVPTKRIKEIRSFIKNNTSRMSYFRGDILYILSFLIGNEENWKSITEKIILVYEELIEKGFKESHYLVLTSYAIVKYSKGKDLNYIINKTHYIYEDMKQKYDNVTNEEDHLQCALLALNDINTGELYLKMKGVFELISDFDMFSRNSVQGLAMTVLLNKKVEDLNIIYNLLKEFENRDIKISHQFLSIIGMINVEDGVQRYVDKVEMVIDYLCEVESQYEFYMDRSFRAFIAIMLIEFSKEVEEERYLEELLSMGVYSFLVSKNQGVFSEVLA